MDVEYAEFQRPRRLASVTHMSAMDVRGGLTFDPLPEGTRMRWSWEVQPHGMLKLMQGVAMVIGRRQERAIWEGLKRVLEEPETHSAHA